MLNSHIKGIRRQQPIRGISIKTWKRRTKSIWIEYENDYRRQTTSSRNRKLDPCGPKEELTVRRHPLERRRNVLQIDKKQDKINHRSNG